ncbi:sporulation YhaL family protein [Fictibacillus sp. WQ 8-8]|uniref:Sporulation YhaL family protein n=1 Tax=Fictibacillus marinisediminis TaxID=2878389 RepID=A0A9X2BFS7_9BACL|nr:MULTISPECIES: sporulation YhaL family protein [Fictibacillus]SFE22450.1 Sporulation protein YhaL [Bacillus sp. OV194]MCK6255868.1 sporulation YhaL family protein [Fictibacillus marinisediminis]MCQ6267043.1 sporulation YhaL family protein [Fictibacillus sp. WQ 8-8]MED2972182.1 sporulation YhaL family protein [Fictibacillus sp. B-59209]UZJ78206.1 sporulation YhaL family protein [Fictibacillus sp. KU28468]
MKGYVALGLGVLLIVAFVLKEFVAPLQYFFDLTPFWVYFVVAGIIFSGYRSYNLGSEQKLLDLKVIEQEGEVFMKRIAEERERRSK